MSVTCQWTLVTAPTLEPLSLAEAKQQARIPPDQTDEDGLTTTYIEAARHAAEGYMNRGLLTQTWKLTLDGFYESIWLPMAAPLAGVTSVKYYDAAGALQTLSTSIYTVDTVCTPGRIVRAPAQAWPVVQADRLSGAVEITYVVGWTAAALVPQLIRQGCRLWVTYLDRDRDGSIDAKDARKAAYACWDLAGRVRWIEPADSLTDAGY